MLKLMHMARQDNSWSKQYSIARKLYHNILKEKKRIQTEYKQMDKILQAEQRTYTYIKPIKTGTIPIALSTEQIEEHLTKTFTKANMKTEITDTNAIHCHPTLCKTYNCPLNYPIQYTEMDSAIKKLKLNKAPGPDGITNNAIKQAKDTLTPLYIILLNEILGTGTLPSQWKVANMKLLFKGKGCKTDPSNYRPLSMENTQMKLFASIVNTRISTHIQYELPDEQYGFRKHRSTSDAITKLLHNITLARQQNKPLYTVFIDFSQALILTNRKH